MHILSIYVVLLAIYLNNVIDFLEIALGDLLLTYLTLIFQVVPTVVHLNTFNLDTSCIVDVTLKKLKTYFQQPT